MKETGCVIKIKTYDRSSNHLTIRAYCGHMSADKQKRCRTYRLSNKDMTEKNEFAIFHSEKPLYHPYKKSNHVSKLNRQNMKLFLMGQTVQKANEKLFQEEDKEKVASTNSQVGINCFK